MRHYEEEDNLELARKAEIYWQMRKLKNLEASNGELVLSRRILTDMTTNMLEFIKKNSFALYYRQEESEMKEELVYLRRKYTEAKHYHERHSLELEYQEREKRYLMWRRNLVNLIVVEEIVPTLEEVAPELVAELRKSVGLITQLSVFFGEISRTTPLLFGVCSEIYKIMLTFEGAKREEEQT